MTTHVEHSGHTQRTVTAGSDDHVDYVHDPSRRRALRRVHHRQPRRAPRNDHTTGRLRTWTTTH